LRQDVEDDLATSKGISLVDSLQHTYLFEVNKKEGDAGFRKSAEQYRVVSVKQGRSLFTCKQLKELANQHLELEEAYREKQEDLVAKVLEIVSTYHPLMEKASAMIAQLDVLAAFADVSACYDYVKPKISGGVRSADDGAESKAQDRQGDQIMSEEGNDTGPAERLQLI